MSPIEQYSNITSPFSIRSRTKWCYTSMCFVWACWVGFFVNDIAPWLSHRITITFFSFMYLNSFMSFIIHMASLVKHTTFVMFLLVNTIVPFHEPWIFHFLLVFKLFAIGYGPTPSKRKDIVLEQEVVKGFELVLHKKKGRILLRIGFLVWNMNGSSFPSGGIRRACNFSKWVGGVEETSSKCCKC